MLKQQFPHLFPLMKARQDVVVSIPGYFDGAHTTLVGLVAPTPRCSDGTHTKICLNFQMNFPELAAQRSPGSNSGWEPGICVLVCLLESPICPGAIPGCKNRRVFLQPCHCPLTQGQLQSSHYWREKNKTCSIICKQHRSESWDGE